MKKLFILVISLICMQMAFAQCPAPENYSGNNYYDDGEFGAKLSWDKASYEFTLDRFEIYRSDNGVDFKMVQRIVNTPSITHYECIDVVDKGGLYFYRIVAFYQDDCESDPIEIEVLVIDYTYVGENCAENVVVYPNPTSGNVNVVAEGMLQISVVNTMGRIVKTQSVDADEVMIDMSSFDNGMYLINIMTENGNIVKRINVLR